MSLQNAAKTLNSAREEVAIEAISELNELLKSCGLGVHSDTQYDRSLEKLLRILIDDGWV